jgi:hypothetical protein
MTADRPMSGVRILGRSASFGWRPRSSNGYGLWPGCSKARRWRACAASSLDRCAIPRLDGRMAILFMHLNLYRIDMRN